MEEEELAQGQVRDQEPRQEQLVEHDPELLAPQ